MLNSKRDKKMINQFPKKIMIQTSSYCNASCIICPYNESSKTNTLGFMSKVLFKKIIQECSLHTELERIMLYLMNEPLTDKSIIERINYAKNRNPNSIIHIVSNASLLHENLSLDLIKSKLDYIEFSVNGLFEKSYEKIMKGLNYNTNLKKILKFIKLAKQNKKEKDFINIKVMGLPGILEKSELILAEKYWEKQGVNVISFKGPTTRASNVAYLPKIKKTEIGGCGDEWRNNMIHILFNGDVVLCCMDWNREVVLGNLNTSSISELWNSKHRKKIEEMIKGKIKSPEDFICKRCDLSIPQIKIF